MSDLRRRIAFAICRATEYDDFKGAHKTCRECDDSYQRVREPKGCLHYKAADAALAEMAQWTAGDAALKKVAEAFRRYHNVDHVTGCTCDSENYNPGQCPGCLALEAYEDIVEALQAVDVQRSIGALDKVILDDMAKRKEAPDEDV